MTPSTPPPTVSPPQMISLEILTSSGLKSCLALAVQLKTWIGLLLRSVAHIRMYQPPSLSCWTYVQIRATRPLLGFIISSRSGSTKQKQLLSNIYTNSSQPDMLHFPSFLNMSSSLQAFFPSSTWSLMWSLVVHFSSLKHHQYNSQFFIPMSQVSQPGLVWFGSWLQCAIDSFTASVLSRPFSNRKTSPKVDSVAVPVTLVLGVGGLLSLFHV